MAGKVGRSGGARDNAGQLMMYDGGTKSFRLAQRHVEILTDVMRARALPDLSAAVRYLIEHARLPKKTA